MPMSDYTMPCPDATYVSRLLESLRQELDGLHRKMDELERLRYYEDTIKLPANERRAGLEVRAGLAAELIENVKASLATNPPRVSLRPHRTGDAATTNASKREKFWNSYLRHINRPVPVLNELLDAQVGLGTGVLKAVYCGWPPNDRRRRPKESDSDYLDRVKGLKKMWGPPFEVVTVHPLSWFYRLGKGNRVHEAIEHSWKSKSEVYANFGIDSDASARSRSDSVLSKKVYEFMVPAAMTGHPEQFVRPLPPGLDTTNLVLTTEYWCKDWYQVYLDRRLVYQKENPPINYFMTIGRSSSSRDPDKIGISVAEFYRHNEPILNRTLTRMAEAAELLVRKRLVVTLPEGESNLVLGESGEAENRKFELRPDAMEALPPGADVKDPFLGVENVYAAMPFIQLMMQLSAQHGVNPIFKGMPPGAAGSGYRDNSLFLMAKSQFQYLVDQYAGCLSAFVSWLEYALVHIIKEPIYIEDLELRPSDVADYPATVDILIEPLLPQNLIAEGQFYSRMRMEGLVSKRIAQEQGLGLEQPDEVNDEILLDQVREALTPILLQDVLATVTGRIAGLSEAEGTNGTSPAGHGMGGAQLMGVRSGGQGQLGQELGGMTRAGQPRLPPEMAGSFPPTGPEGV